MGYWLLFSCTPINTFIDVQEDVGGCIYGQELDYVFGLPISGVWPHVSYHYTRAEVILSAIVISYWANFVKDG